MNFWKWYLGGAWKTIIGFRLLEARVFLITIGIALTASGMIFPPMCFESSMYYLLSLINIPLGITVIAYVEWLDKEKDQ